MKLLPLLYYKYRRFARALSIFAMVLGPGIIVMVADNDAGGITTYSVTGAKFLYSFVWVEIILGPVAYVCQEMTVRLGAITKRGHAEAIFDAFGPFWGWFSLMDLTLTDVLTIVTEFIGMTAAMQIFGIPPLLTEIAVILLIMAMVIQGRYWTWEKVVLVFCGQPDLRSSCLSREPSMAHRVFHRRRARFSVRTQQPRILLSNG